MMDLDNSVKHEIGNALRVTAILLIFITILAVASAYSSVSRIYKSAYNKALSEAQKIFEENGHFLSWISAVKEIYVPLSEEALPDPYLEGSKQTITAKDGEALVRVNPAYMVRAIHEIAAKSTVVRNHLTGSNPLRPGNQPDNWEAKALKKLEGGSVAEVSEVVNSDEGTKNFRHIASLKAEAICISCHSVQGYKEGDVLGGVSTTFPYEPFLEEAKRDSTSSVLTFLVLWFAVSAVIVSVARRETRLIKLRLYSEKELKDANFKMDSLLEERLRDIRTAKERAEFAGQVKSNFIAGISHRIRNPLNGVIGSADLLLRTKLESEQANYVYMIKSAGHSMLGVLSDILDFAKFEARKIELELKEFDLRKSVFGAVRGFTSLAHAKHLEITAEVNPEVPEFYYGDSYRLSQVLSNLVSNAVKFTEKGRVSLTVNLKEDKLLLFTVEDTGIGIDETLKEKIRASFDKEELESRYGKGVGLIITAYLLKLMGTELNIESAPLGGTTLISFELALPAAARFSVPHEDMGKLVGVRALVMVEKERERAILFKQLSFWNMLPAYKTEAAYKSAAAERNLPYDVVITDAHGEKPAFDNLPVITLSSSEEFSTEGEKPLLKPVNSCELLLALLPAVGIRPLTDRSKHLKYSGLKALLVEDTELNLVVAEKMLQDLGCTVERAVDGKEALKYYEKSHFDIIFMDIEMPIMDGVSATKAIRALEARSGKGHIPIVAMTAHAIKGDREKYISYGMDNYITKPLFMDRLVDIINATMDMAYALAKADKNANIEGYARREEGGEVSETLAKMRMADNIVIPALAQGELLLDKDLFKKHFMGLESIMGKTVEVFLQTAPKLSKEIEEAIKRSDNGALKTKSHALKGCASYFSDTVKRVSMQLEMMGRHELLPDKTEEAEQIYMVLKQMLERLSDEIKNSKVGKG